MFWSYAAADYAYLEAMGASSVGESFPDRILNGLRRLNRDRALFQGAFRDWIGPQSLCMTLVRHGLAVIPDYIRRRYGVAAVTDGPYHEFERSQTIAPGVHYIFAPGHTKGNSIVIVENDGLFYMLAGDVTYCDAALKANKLSVIFEDKAAARDTLDRVRAFIKARPTVYLSTHCPEGYESLELKRVMKLA